MLDLTDFRIAVRNYRLVPERLLGAFALGLPLAELGCAALLIAGVATGPAAAVLVAMLAIFVFAISVNLLRGRTFSCGCSGKTSADITWWHVLVNTVLALMAALVSVWAVQPLTVAAGWGLGGGPVLSGSQALAVLLAAATAAALALLLTEAVAVRRILSSLRPPGHPGHVHDLPTPAGEVTP